MGYIHLPLAWSLIWLSLCIFSSIGDDGQVCERLRLVKLSDVPTGSKARICEELNYPEWICERIRPVSIGLLKDIYSVQLERVCCPGWLHASIESDESDSEDEDEKELECVLPCKEGFFGQDCKFECGCIHGTSHHCNPVDGSCDCLDGLMGRDCDERCSPGYFGPNCHERSIFTCMNGGENHPVTGHCLCRSSYDGSSCETECESIEKFDCGIIDCENCIQNRTLPCDLVKNACSCRDGWKGRYCSDPCDIGTRGQLCAESCCSGRGYCTGESCLCANGYHGNECQHKCEGGTFGRNCEGQCLCPLSCNHVTGVCEECPPGFTGDRCTVYCSPTKWGQSCNHTCSCEEGERCDIFSGECFSSDSIELYLLAGIPGIVVLLALITFGVLCAVCKRYKKRQRAQQTEQTHINSATLPTPDSSSGYLSIFEMNSYTVPRDVTSPLHRNESVTSDGYLEPIQYYTISEAVSEKPTSNG